MAWNSWSGWDTAGQIGGALGGQLEVASAFFQRTSEELARQATTSAERAEMYRAAWQTLDNLTIAAMHDLNALSTGNLDAQIKGRVAALRIELTKAEVFLKSAGQNSFAASELKALGKNLGAVIGAAEILYQLNGDNFTAYEYGETGLGLVGASIGAGIAILISAGAVGTIFAGVALGFGAKLFWEKGIAPQLGWTEKNSPLFWDALFDALGLNPNLSNATNSSYSAARTWAPPRDPLVLDLDGDGIEAVGIDPSRPILFDHDGDGTRNATGWIGSDDGLLALDRNGNGLIDSGRELFGDQTLRDKPAADGSTTFANGYEALAAQDAITDKKRSAISSTLIRLHQTRIQMDDKLIRLAPRVNVTA